MNAAQMKLVAQNAEAFVHAFLNRDPRCVLATINERQTLAFLKVVIDEAYNSDREKVAS